jgi:hypothetical protein
MEFTTVACQLILHAERKPEIEMVLKVACITRLNLSLQRLYDKCASLPHKLFLELEV